MQIPREAEQIIERLKDAGFEAYVVGGCVRDMLLGRTPGDWDITTSALPAQVKAVFGRTIDTGIQHGTVTVMRGKTGYEVTTYRIDGEYEDGRHPKSVAFTASLEEDLKRRDFTINAMAYSHKDGLVDIFGGQADLCGKQIRCVGNPMDRFTEDALRILRAIRFSAQLDFEIEPETRRAITVIAPNLVHVSKERIQVELTKLLTSDHPEQMRLVFETGISPYISDAFDKIPSEKTEVDPNLPKEKAVRWAAFLHLLSPSEAVKVLRDLKLDNDTISQVRLWTTWWNVPLQAEASPLRKVMSQMSEEQFDRLLLLKQSIPEAPETNEQLAKIRELTEEIRTRGDCVRLKDMAVSGADLIEAGMKPGKELGAVLGRLFEMVLEQPECNTKEYLLSQVLPENNGIREEDR